MAGWYFMFADSKFIDGKKKTPTKQTASSIDRSQSITFSTSQHHLEPKMLHCETISVNAPIICIVISKQYLSIAGAEWMWHLNSSGLCFALSISEEGILYYSPFPCKFHLFTGSSYQNVYLLNDACEWDFKYEISKPAKLYYLLKSIFLAVKSWT